MIIGIDGNEANVSRRVGIGVYAYKLLEHLYSIVTENLMFKIYLKEAPLPDMPLQKNNWKYTIVKPRNLWTQIALPFNLYTTFPRPNIFFSPSHYSPRFCPVPSVISIMDLSFFHYPEMFNRRDLYQLHSWTRYSVQKASRIFTISKSSKDDIIKLFNIDEAKITVTYPGVDEKNVNTSMKSLQSILKKYELKNNYFLFVGTLQPRKNIQRLIEAFSFLAHQVEDVDLLIVGKKGWLYREILDAPKKLGIESRVKFLDFVPDEDLALLYTGAICFVLPSLYEGFGFPILEAMAYGCPVITSNVSSLPEVGGDAVLYVDPMNVSEISNALEKMFKDKEVRKKYSERGKKQVKKFNWEKTAEETLKILKEVVNQ